MLLKQKNPSLLKNLVLGTRIANSVLNKGKAAIPSLFNGPEVLSSASDKAKLFAKNFSKNSNLDDAGISLSVFSSRTNPKRHKKIVYIKRAKNFENRANHQTKRGKILKRFLKKATLIVYDNHIQNAFSILLK